MTIIPAAPECAVTWNETWICSPAVPQCPTPLQTVSGQGPSTAPRALEMRQRENKAEDLKKKDKSPVLAPQRQEGSTGVTTSRQTPPRDDLGGENWRGESQSSWDRLQ